MKSVNRCDSCGRFLRSQPEASEFGQDDRAEVEQVGQTEQDSLFLDVDEDQVTLSGEEASGKPKYE